MRASTARLVLAPSQGYVCLSCRLHSATARTGRSSRQQQSSRPEDTRSEKHGIQTLLEASNIDKGATSSSSSTITEILKGLIPKDSTRAGGDSAQKDGRHVSSPAVMRQEDPLRDPEPANSGEQTTQVALQHRFAAARRKQRLQSQPGLLPKELEVANDKLGLPVSNRNPVTKPAKPLSQKVSRQQRLLNRAAQRQKAKQDRRETYKAKEAAKQAQDVLDLTEGKKLLASALLEPCLQSKLQQSTTVSVPQEVHENMPADDHSDLGPLGKDEGPARTVMSKKPATRTRKVMSTMPRRILKRSESDTQKNNPSKSVSEQTRDAELQAKVKRGKDRLSECERKAALARKLGAKIHKHPAVDDPHFEAQATFLSTARRKAAKRKSVALSKSKLSGTPVSDVAGFDSLQGALGRKGAKSKTAIERADATQLEILPLEIDQPPVPSLSYGLERVLFNPGVYQLQDPRSRVYNFDPYLQKIMPVAEFDFNALKEYITSSRDESLNRIAKENGKRYMGSTSSMTAALSHFHFLLSQWRPINTSMMSKEFPAHLSSFTELQRTPQAIFLRWKDGSYAIDADKQFASANVLSMLGKSMEKLLTLSTDDYEKYRKSSRAEVTDEESLAPESYHYSTMGDFLMRSQLDAHDPRLPGTGMFDLKTRAVVSIRMDVSKYEHGLGYQIKSRQGQWESYEREYYDMIRAAFLKYSMQVRMGRMDGIFVAFHNIERIFGFQYISLPEMDSTIHGQWDTSIGDQEFKLSLDLLNKILDKATKKYPETSLRIHFETRDAATPFMYIFAKPVTEEQVAGIQSQNDAKIQEFEHNILGLRRKEESELQDDDGKWENIQASVQEAMDNDELSIDDSSQDQESEDEEMESEPLHSPRDVLEGGALYADRAGKAAEEGMKFVTTLSESETETKNVRQMANQEHLPEKEEDEEIDEENGEDVAIEEDRVLADHGEPNHGLEATEAESAILQDHADKLQASDESALEQSERSEDEEVESRAESQHDGGEDARKLGQPLEKELKQEMQTPPEASNEDGVQKAEKDAYTPPVPGEESSETNFQTEADRSFLDAMNEETAHLETSISESPGVLAMTLTVRNKVNDQFVLRPEKLTADDVWSIEYSLVEVPKQERARALYEACQTRRKKKLDAPMVPEDAEVIGYYLTNLRNISTKGKKWRKEMDEKDRSRPIQVLGKEIVTNDGDVARSDRDAEA